MIVYERGRRNGKIEPRNKRVEIVRGKDAGTV